MNFTNLFVGSWHFERNVKGLFPHSLDFDGGAHFIQDGDYSRYNEFGRYTLNDQSIDFATSYLYHLIAPTHCRVLFPDQRLFYELTRTSQKIDHLCGQDHYKAQFEYLSQDHWELHWHIDGPRKKNTQIMTSYFRA